MTAAQEHTIQRWVADKAPDQLRMPFALWTRSAICVLFQQRYSIRMPVRTIDHYLRRGGFTPQKPLKRSYEQRPEEVHRWLSHDCPTIAARAKPEDAEIHWSDESCLRTSDPSEFSIACPPSRPSADPIFPRANACRKPAAVVTISNRSGYFAITRCAMSICSSCTLA